MTVVPQSSQHWALALGLRDGPSQLPCRFDPEVNRILDVPQRGFLIVFGVLVPFLPIIAAVIALIWWRRRRRSTGAPPAPTN